jgi:NAD(P)-dependent dehydrogenase (short-subunit alcohol dehydrogenase family)
MSNTVLITGTSRGLGLEFTKQYAEAGWQVYACCRSPEKSLALQSLVKTHSNIIPTALDVMHFDEIDRVASQLSGVTIDLLINNAGVYPESRLGDVDYQDWERAFKINGIAPFKMIDAFLPNIMSSQLKKVATLSSKMGSIDDNGSGGSYIYRSTKTAVNMVMKSLSIDLSNHGIAIVTLHPGWVQTDMGGPNGLISAQTSVRGLRDVIEQLSMETTGKFIAFDGKEIAW